MVAVARPRPQRVCEEDAVKIRMPLLHPDVERKEIEALSLHRRLREDSLSGVYSVAVPDFTGVAPSSPHGRPGFRPRRKNLVIYFASVFRTRDPSPRRLIYSVEGSRSQAGSLTD